MRLGDDRQDRISRHRVRPTGTSRRPSSQSRRARLRWILPLVVFGNVLGRISMTWRAYSSCSLATASRISADHVVGVDPVARGALDLLHDHQRFLAGSSGTENAAPPSGRSAGCAACTVRSMSCG